MSSFFRFLLFGVLAIGGSVSAHGEDSFLRLRTDQITMEKNICIARLSGDGIDAEAAAPAANDNKSCVIETPVILKSATAGRLNGQPVLFPDKPMLGCAFASQFAGFVTRLADPYAEATLGAGVASVQTGPGYDCRIRNHAASGKISAHGSGLAADIGTIKLTDGRVLTVGTKDAGMEKNYLENLGRAACGFFSTVLGPNGDPNHKDHLHFDAEVRRTRGSGHFCQP